MHLQIFTFIRFYSNHELNIIHISEMHINLKNPYYDEDLNLAGEDHLSNKNGGGVSVRLVTL